MQYRASHRTEPPKSILGAQVRLGECKVNDGTESEVNCLTGRKGCQEKGIKPKILIEPLMRDEINTPCKEIHVYCFNGIPKIIIKLNNNGISLYDENLNQIDDLFGFENEKIYLEADDLINQSFVLSKQLAKNFNFVRVDFMISNQKLYFCELTFTPYSGFFKFDKNLQLGKLMDLSNKKREL